MKINSVTILDYGVGNISAFKRIYEDLGVNTIVANNTKDIDNAEKLILPGVGSFDWVMSKLEKSGLKDSINQSVLSGVPILGVCVGMQMMFDYSEEGRKKGFGWIPGCIKKINQSAQTEKIIVPNMGWVDIKIQKDSPLFYKIHNSRFYFLHSYSAVPENASNIIAMAKMKLPIVAAVQKNNIFGTQFHPEKSHGWGIFLLKNFMEFK